MKERLDVAFSSRPCPMVELRHELPDGSHHIDWLLARDPGGREPLVSFRLERPLFELLGAIEAGETAKAQRIQDHRPKYLEYEGPISRNRGHVRRVSSGTVELVKAGDHPCGVVLRLTWRLPGSEPCPPVRVHLRPETDDQWLIERLESA